MRAPGILIAVALWSWAASPVQAQIFHTWFGSSGNDTGGCGTASSPCKSLFFAIVQTAAGGEVQCKDATLLDDTNIVKSITITCDIPLSSNTNGAGPSFLSISVGPNDAVVLRGLNFQGGEYNYNFSQPAIDFKGSGTLILDNVKITGAYTSGVLFEPNGPARLQISNSLFTRNGNLAGKTGAAIRVWPQGAGSARVHLDHVTAVDNAFGIAIDGTASSSGINATIADSAVSGNLSDGMIATTDPGHAPVGVLATNIETTNNAYGIRSIGPNVTVRVENSKIVGNDTGLSNSGGGALLTFGNNAVRANGVDGAFSGPVGLQ